MLNFSFTYLFTVWARLLYSFIRLLSTMRDSFRRFLSVGSRFFVLISLTSGSRSMASSLLRIIFICFSSLAMYFSSISVCGPCFWVFRLLREFSMVSASLISRLRKSFSSRFSGEFRVSLLRLYAMSCCPLPLS